ncbi:alpha/beta fold hydrolase [Microbacterium sp. X-17]|uniref:alpha/beta hydrolase family protein n=1 Tax=Microbacterium sp. X-17 TaxID=3144404 RepID=UPI0031F4EA4B
MGDEFAVSDEFFDGQTLRAASAALFGGADIGECIAIARRVRNGDLDSWHTEWFAAAEKAFALGEEAEAAGQGETARLAFLRACTYFRTAGIVYLAQPVDPRLPESLARQRDAFRRAIPHQSAVIVPVEIPFDGIMLPGYHYRVADDGRQRPTVILVDGYDGTVEELYFGNAQAALDRGYDVLAFDGPGQGSVLIEQGVHLRPDWENVLPSVVDWVVAQPTTDPERIAVIGWSLGGFLAPRGASGERRLAACIADANLYDMFDIAVSRMPAAVRGEIPDGNRVAIATVQTMLDTTMRRPTEGWSFRRGLYVHGVETGIDYIRDMRGYTLNGFAEQIACPTLICRGESDDVSETASLTFDALTCPKEFIEFRDADGAGGHCEMGARQLYLARAYGWLDAILQPERAVA